MKMKYITIEEKDKEAIYWIEHYRKQSVMPNGTIIDLPALHKIMYEIYGAYSLAVPRLAELEEFLDSK